MPYKPGVGSLMYAIVATQADLAFAMSIVSQFMSRAGPTYWSAVKCIMRYLQSTIDYKLCLDSEDLALRRYCDADWTRDTIKRRSTTRYVFFVGVGTKEALWLQKLLANVGFVQDGATTIMCNNQRCIAFAKNPTHYSRTKLINVQHHFICKKLESGKICLKYCPTEDMVADILTKALAKD